MMYPFKKLAPGIGGIIACDCEMSYTVGGIELTRVTLVGFDGTRLLDEIVRPIWKLVDANTRFSGVSEADLRAATVTFDEVWGLLSKFVGADTILVGHGLENDLKAMRVCMPFV